MERYLNRIMTYRIYGLDEIGYYNRYANTYDEACKMVYLLGDTVEAVYREETSHFMHDPEKMRSYFETNPNKCTCPGVACPVHGLPSGSSSGGW